MEAEVGYVMAAMGSKEYIEFGFRENWIHKWASSVIVTNCYLLF